MKPYEIYQHLPGEPLTDRDKKQVGSKFWGQGKWDNFVAPHLPQDCSGLSFVDMGCNAGLFLKFAQDRGFKRIIGVDSNKEAVERGKKWAQENGGRYSFLRAKLENCIHALPIVDYTLLCNSHYYFNIVDWINYIDQLRLKTHRVIIVTTEKRNVNRNWARSSIEDLRGYFKDWKEVGFVDELPTEGDPDPRRLWSICFESPDIEKVELEKLGASNHVQSGFYKDIETKDYKNTKYYRILKPYRKNWSEDQLNNWIEDKIKTYKDIKEKGQFKPILFDDRHLILDGNHRWEMLKQLGNYAFGRRIRCTEIR